VNLKEATDMMANNELDTHNELVAILEQEFELVRQRDEKKTNDLSFLPEWFLGKIQRMSAARDEIKKRSKELLAHIDAEERALFFRWGEEFRKQVDNLIAQKGKGKQVKLLTGTAGYRTSGAGIEIIDKEKAIAWALDHLTHAELLAAIPSLNKTPFAEKVQRAEVVNTDTGEVNMEVRFVPPGCEVVEKHESFFPAAPKKALPEGETNV